MSFLYKLIFDVSLYYVFSTYIYSLFPKSEPSFMGFVLIAILIIIRSLIEKSSYSKSKISRVSYLIPLALLLFKLPIVNIILMLPPWAYIIYCFEKKLFYNDIERIRSFFTLGLRLMLVFIIGFVYPSGRKAFTQSIPYIVAFLFFGVCLLRILREEKESSVRQLIVLIAFLCVCAVLTIGQAPQMLVSALGFIYKYIISYIFLGICLLFIGIFWLLGRLFSLISKKTPSFNELPTITADSAADLLGIDETFVTRDSPVWVKPIMISLAAIVAVLIIVIVFRKLAGNRIKPDKPVYFEIIESVSGQPVKKKTSLRRRNLRDRIINTFISIIKESEKKHLLKRELSETAGEILLQIEPKIDSISVDDCLNAFSSARYSEITALSHEMLENEEKVLKAVRKYKIDKT